MSNAVYDKTKENLSKQQKSKQQKRLFEMGIKTKLHNTKHI